MFTTIITYLPMFVSAIMAVMMAVDIIDRYQRVKIPLLVFLVTCTLLYAGHAIFFSGYTELIPVSDTIYCFANLAVYPLYYIYVCYLTESETRRRYFWLYLLPAVICALATGYCYVMMDDKETTFFIENYLYHNETAALTGNSFLAAVVHQVAKVIFGLQIIPVLLFGLQKINRYNDTVRRNYADTDTRLLVHIKTMYIVFFITAVVSTISNILGRYRFVESPEMLAIPSVLFSILIFILVYVELKRDFTMEDMEKEIGASPKTSKPRKTVKGANSAKELCKRIDQLMEEEKLFLQHDLKISDLSVRLGSNRNYIYNAINVEMGINFADYINRQRIEYAAKMMREHPGMQMNELYIKTGFASSSSFYRNFRLYMGCSPKEYMENSKF